MHGLFKQMLAAGRLVRVLAVGRLPHPIVIEILGHADGYDGVWLDQEHAGLTTEQITTLSIACRANHLGCFVRMPFTHYSLVSQNLESGVDGVMAARIANVAEAQRFAAWCKFHPLGYRGINTSGADGHYTGKEISEFAADTNQANFVAIQIETLGSLKDVEEIAALEAVDLLFVGPADLSQELGRLGQPDHPDVWDAIEQVAKACAKHGKHWGIVPAGPKYAERCVELGCRMITIGNDVSALRLGIASVKHTYQSMFTKTKQ